MWQYGYDDRDELTSASRRWSAAQNNAFVSGQQFTYAYDNIGNRLTDRVWRRHERTEPAHNHLRQQQPE